MAILFLAAAGLLLHTYVLYPLSLLSLGLLRRRVPHSMDEEATPSMTLVISAYNEAQILPDKIANSLALDYPKDRLRVLIVSDGSTDGTESIAAQFAASGIELRSFAGRRGKVACLNEILPGLRSDLVVMSDANSMYQSDSLRRLARHFGDPGVGCVCGELQYTNPRKLSSGEGERVYWRYERLIKRVESGLGSLLGANGAIYAFRTPLFQPVNPLMFCDDVIPIRIRLLGFLTLYEPEARCTEEAVPENAEARRRQRHASFGLRSMLRMCHEAARKGDWLVFYQCVSHRILRWMGGPCLLALLVAGTFLPPPWNRLALLLQGAFYGAAVLGFASDRLGRRVTVLYLPYYFLVITGAGLAGLWKYLSGTDQAFWEPRQ